MADSDTNFGALDEEASAALDDLLATARAMGADIDAGQMMSRAVRLYHGVVNGHVEILPSPELSAQMEQERAGAWH